MPSNPRIDDLRKRLEKDPGSRLFAQLAEELRKEGELTEAIGVARLGLEKHPAYPSARMTLGRALFDSGEVAGARVEFETVLKGAPDNILASRLLAECLEKAGETVAAISRYRATLMMAPGDKQVQARLRELEAEPKAAVSVPGRAGPAASAAVQASAEPLPIPLVAASEEFELEQSREAATLPAVLRESPGARPAPIPSQEGQQAGSAAIAEAPVGAGQSDLPPIPLVEADDRFELERPSDTAPSPRGAPVAAPGPAAPEPSEFEFEVPARTLPFQSESRVLLEDAIQDRTSRPSAAEEEGTHIASSTLAELYFNQGFTDKAIDVYRQVMQREPENHRAKARLAELEGLERQLRAEEGRSASADPGVVKKQSIERTIARLEGLLSAIKRG